MTQTINRTASTVVAPPRSEQPAQRLRAVLAANAATSFVCGVAGVAAAPYWSETLGVGSPGWVRIVSAGLVLFAVDVGIIAARAKASLPAAALAISAGDLAWVAATVVALATVEFTTVGWLIAAVIGIGVLDFALLQLWYRSRIERFGRREPWR